MKRRLFLCFIYGLLFVNLSILVDTPQQSVHSISSSMIKSGFEGTTLEFDELSFYNLTVRVNSDDSIEGNMTVDFINIAPVEFDAIPFQLFLGQMDYETQQGSMDIVSIIANNGTDMQWKIQDYILWVNLTNNLSTGERARFTIEFESILPRGLDRANINGNDSDKTKIITAVNFYPNPCTWDNPDEGGDGWNTDLYLEVGDPYYHDMAYYDFILTLDAEYVVAATGDILEKTISPKEGTATYHFNAKLPVREVVFCASKHYLVDSRLVNGVNISSFYLPSSSLIWGYNGLYYTSEAFKTFESEFGDYPYSTLNTVESAGWFGGMEYPCQVMITKTSSEGYLQYVITHEIAHQWWYQLVGNDEVDWGFLDEGITVWSTDFALYDDSSFESYFKFDNVRIYSLITDSQPNKINESIYENEISGTNYWYTAYQKTPAILEKLRQIIGTSNFVDGLSLFFDRFVWKIAKLNDLQVALEDSSGMDLDWFFKPWFNNYFIPSYAIEKAIFYPENRTLEFTVKDENADLHEYAYSQRLTYDVEKNGDIAVSSGSFWMNGSKTTVSVQLDIDKPYSVKIPVKSSSHVLTQLQDTEQTDIETEIDKHGQTTNIPSFTYLFTTFALIGIYTCQRIFKK